MVNTPSLLIILWYQDLFRDYVHNMRIGSGDSGRLEKIADTLTRVPLPQKYDFYARLTPDLQEIYRKNFLCLE